MSEYGQRSYNLSEPAYSRALSYYERLLNGSRAAMGQATAPEADQIRDLYTGAERSIERGGVRGAQRDQAIVDIARDKTRSLANLTRDGRRYAAESLADMGSRGMSTGLSAMSGAGANFSGAASTYGGLLGDERQRQATRFSQMYSIGQAIGKILLPYLLQSQGQGGRGAQAPGRHGGYADWLPNNRMPGGRGEPPAIYSGMPAPWREGLA